MKTLVTLLLLLSSLWAQAQHCGPVYVRSGAEGANTGTSWADAFTSMQDAIDAVQPGGQIWVAAGVYKPEKDTSGNAAPAVARTKTFFINKDIQLYGGFAGTEQGLGQRNPAANETVLSGDLGVEGVASDNAYHVLWIALVSPVCVIDGFTITRGNANGFGTGESQGGGILIQHAPLQYATPIIRNCIIEHNNASSGGGLYTATDSWGAPSIRVENCKFRSNTATSGGGIYFQQNATAQVGLALADVEFSGQNILQYGGGLYAVGHYTARNCRFEGNSANRGAGVNMQGGTAVFETCTFISNTSLRNGGGMRIEAGTATLDNCLFMGNEANILNESGSTSNAGGGLFYRGSNATFIKLANCVFSGNKGQNGAGFAQTTSLFNTSSAELDNCTFTANSGASAVARIMGNLTLDNGIVYGNAGTPLTGGTARNCIVEGGYAGPGNLNVNPLFVNMPSHFLAPTAAGNLRLQAGSPAIDQGDNNIASLHIVADAGGNHRMVNCRIDIGAFEFGNPGASDRTCFVDADGDGWGDGANPRLFCNTCPAGFVSNNSDCDDANPAISHTLPPPNALQLNAEFCRGEPETARRTLSAQAPGRLVWVLVQAPPGSRFAGMEPLVFEAGEANAEFSAALDRIIMCSTPSFQGTDIYGAWVFEAWYETTSGCRSAARQGFTALIREGAATGLIAASDSLLCPGSEVVLYFQATAGQAPFDIVVNGQTYSGLTNGAAFDTLVAGVDFSDSLVLLLQQVSDTVSCEAAAGVVQELVLYASGGISGVSAVPLNAFCSTPTGQATAVVQGGVPPFQYLWDDGQTTATASGLSPGTHQVVVTDASGCTALGAVQIAPQGGAGIVYVNASAAGNGNGSSWEHAFVDLQEALVAAAACPDGAEIWVAQGTYRPDRGTRDRNASFHLLNKVALYGGFAGTEMERDERDWTSYPTILSGDIGLMGDSTDNSYSVVTAINVDSTGLIDGFAIRDGNADAVVPNAFTPLNAGGGMFCNGSDVKIRNCAFQRNAAYVGGGLFHNVSGNPSISNCSFLDNTARDSGGGLYNVGRPRIESCYFARNRALFGGGLANQGFNSLATVLHSEFVQNTAGYGGGVHNGFIGTIALSHCSFIGNTASNQGGGASNFGNQARFVHCRFEENSSQGNGGGFSGSILSSAQLLHCSFTGNTSAEKGGGIYSPKDLVLQNCLLSGNRASAGGGIYYDIASGLDVQMNHCTFSGNFAGDRGGAIAVDIAAGLSNFSVILENSIVWGNSANGQGRQIWSSPGSALALFSTCYPDSPGDVIAQGAFSADAGSITTNPLFLEPLPASSAPTAGGDYRLSACSPAVDAGNPGLIPAGITSDLDGNPRILGAGVDMGAYETTATQSVLTLMPVVTPPSCFGMADASATIGVEGGAPPFSFLWSSGQTTATASGLSPGSYTVSVSDAAGCAGEMAITIPVTPVLESQAILLQQPSCNGSLDGAASVEAIGGTPPYNYLWSNGQTSASATGLPPGTYSVTTTDARGCTAVENITLTAQYQMLIALTVIQNLACNGDSTAAVTATPMGGVAPYTYQWAHGPATASVSGLPAGMYPVSITDANNCTVTGTALFSDPPALEVVVEVQQLSCREFDAGVAALHISGGMTPYAILWSDGQTGHTATGLEAGAYTATVTDDNNCTTVAVAVVAADTFNLQVIVEQGFILHAAENNATYQWINCATGQPVPGATGQAFIPAESGSYAVELSRGACRETSACVPVMVVSAGEAGHSPQAATVFPNPNDGRFVLRLPLAADVSIYTPSGTIVEKGRYAPGDHALHIEAPAGVYLLVLRRTEGLETIRVVRQ